MRKFKNSFLIIPLSIIVHLGIINGILYLLTPATCETVPQILYINISWLIISLGLRYYTYERKEVFATKLHVMFRLYITYGLAYFAMFSFTGTPLESLPYQLFVYGIICLTLTWYRVMYFWTLRRYRRVGGNSVTVVVIGRDKSLRKIRNVFDDPGLGYRYEGYFDDNPSNSPTYLGKILDCFGYILNNEIDEIYCVASRFNRQEMRNFIDFADNNLIKFKIILDHKEIFSRGMSIESYDEIPVLNLRKVPLDTHYARITKRSFDLIFSLFMILFVLSWLTPLLFVLIKLESKGPLFFSQKRHGLKRKTFWCYKFRTMAPNREADQKMASKNDTRITTIGRFLRKTSLDEMPQFFNVLLGNMSVVGPRPHMLVHTEDYQTSVDKYLVRHFVKPGITGLAQIRGYRGEIIEKRDIEHRTSLDIFYVEKWNFWLDLVIIFETIRKAVDREEKAY